LWPPFSYSASNSEMVLTKVLAMYGELFQDI
jgi:hypothetical protein